MFSTHPPLSRSSTTTISEPSQPQNQVSVISDKDGFHSDLYLRMDKTNIPAAKVLSIMEPIIEKATLEARIRQVGSSLLNTQSQRNANAYTSQIAQYISTRKSYVDFVGEHVQSRLDNSTKLKRLCKDYQLYSPNLDGSVQEMLQKVEEGAENDGIFFAQMLKMEEAEIKSIAVECLEMVEIDSTEKGRPELR
jgi:hypothetical protein